MTHFCPSCGYNLTRDEPITLGDWHLTPYSASYKGEQLRQAPQSLFIFLYTVGAAGGAPVAVKAILNRLGSEAIGNVLAVYATRWRLLLKANGWPVPFRADYRGGYMWTTL